MENSKPNMHALVKACDNLGITYKKVDKAGNFLSLDFGDQQLYFTYTRVPLNSESVAGVCSSKIYSYWALSDELPMSTTKSYLDPEAVEEYGEERLIFKSQTAIVEDILESFKFPFIVKMNSGLQGRHVYKCSSKASVAKCVKAIYKKKQENYDSCIIVQDFIDIKNEYRAILVEGEVVLLYEKVSEMKTTNLSPLHNDDGRAVIIKDEDIKNDIQRIVDGSPKLKSFGWIGLDIARDYDGKWWVLELNVRPGFSYFLRDNDASYLVSMYEKLLTRIKNGKK